MFQWEYLVVEQGLTGREVFAVAVNGQDVPLSKRVRLYDYINALGKQGWEMVGVASWGSKPLLYFKKSKLSSPEQLK
jgi:hypothetical protein